MLKNHFILSTLDVWKKVEFRGFERLHVCSLLADDWWHSPVASLWIYEHMQHRRATISRRFTQSHPTHTRCRGDLAKKKRVEWISLLAIITCVAETIDEIENLLVSSASHAPSGSPCCVSLSLSFHNSVESRWFWKWKFSHISYLLPLFAFLMSRSHADMSGGVFCYDSVLIWEREICSHLQTLRLQ